MTYQYAIGDEVRIFGGTPYHHDPMSHCYFNEKMSQYVGMTARITACWEYEGYPRYQLDVCLPYSWVWVESWLEPVELESETIDIVDLSTLL